jgi:hypothetical protein
MYPENHFSAASSCTAREESLAHSTIAQYFSKKYPAGSLTSIVINGNAFVVGGAA